MKLLTDAAGNPVVRNSKLVLVNEAEGNKEIEIDVVGIYNTNARLFGENRGHREKVEELQGKLSAYAGIEDPKAAIEALNKVKTIGTKESELASKIEEARRDATAATEAKYAPLAKENETLKSERSQMRMATAFQGSEYAKKALAIPADMAQTFFGKHFAEKDGKIVPVNADGSAVYSRRNPGEVASFDEGLELAVQAYAGRDSILKGTGASGGGSTGSQGGGGSQGAGGKTVMTRQQFDALPPAEKAAAAAKSQIVD